MSKKEMVPAFKIFKEGKTTDWVTILQEKGVPFNKQAKIQKYVSLGYTVSTEI